MIFEKNEIKGFVNGVIKMLNTNDEYLKNIDLLCDPMHNRFADIFNETVLCAYYWGICKVDISILDKVLEQKTHEDENFDYISKMLETKWNNKTKKLIDAELDEFLKSDENE